MFNITECERLIDSDMQRRKGYAYYYNKQHIKSIRRKEGQLSKYQFIRQVSDRHTNTRTKKVVENIHFY